MLSGLPSLLIANRNVNSWLLAYLFSLASSRHVDNHYKNNEHGESRRSQHVIGSEIVDLPVQRLSRIA